MKKKLLILATSLAFISITACSDHHEHDDDTHHHNDDATEYHDEAPNHHDSLDSQANQ